MDLSLWNFTNNVSVNVTRRIQPNAELESNLRVYQHEKSIVKILSAYYEVIHDILTISGLHKIQLQPTDYV